LSTPGHTEARVSQLVNIQEQKCNRQEYLADFILICYLTHFQYGAYLALGNRMNDGRLIGNYLK
jgi:hypothetical protein